MTNQHTIVLDNIDNLDIEVIEQENVNFLLEAWGLEKHAEVHVQMQQMQYTKTDLY